MGVNISVLFIELNEVCFSISIMHIETFNLMSVIHFFCIKQLVLLYHFESPEKLWFLNSITQNLWQDAQYVIFNNPLIVDKKCSNPNSYCTITLPCMVGSCFYCLNCNVINWHNESVYVFYVICIILGLKQSCTIRDWKLSPNCSLQKIKNRRAFLKLRITGRFNSRLKSI